MISFPSNPTPRNLEEFLGDVRQHPGQALRMPILQKWGGGYGASAQAVQAVATWARLHTGTRTIHLPESFHSNADTKDRFASSLIGMASLYFADAVKAGQADIRRYDALLAVAPRVEAMQRSRFRDTLRGVGIALCCFGGAKNEFLPALYAQPEHGAVRGVAGFHVLVPRLLGELSVGALELIPEAQVQHLSHLIHELFANADEHGSFDVDGSEYASTVRGLTIRVRSISDVKSVVASAGEDNPLRSYLSKAAVLPISFGAVSTTKSATPDSTAQFLELSVFDCGPGLALRWLSKFGTLLNYGQISAEEEIEAVRTCFKKHATTRSLSGSGQGLTQALSVMKRLKAFMTLRTGRVSLYQDFTRGDTTDFSAKHRFGVHELPVIAGTSFTICFRIK